MGIPKGVVLMDRATAPTPACAPRSPRWGLPNVAAIQPHTSLWAPGTGPLPPKPSSGRGRKHLGKEKISEV